MPPAFPRQAIALSSILLVIGLVTFPSLAKIITSSILVGGGIFFVQSRFLTAKPAVVQMTPMDRTVQKGLAKQQAQQPKPADAPLQTGKSPANSSATSQKASVVAQKPAPTQSTTSLPENSGAIASQPQPSTAPTILPPPTAVASAAAMSRATAAKLQPPPNGTTTPAVVQTGGAAVLARLRYSGSI